jgi:cell division transport system ATP-binding protein
MTLLQEINRLGTTMLVVTHEQNLVEEFSNRVITIDDGLISSDRMDGRYEYEDK